MREQLEQVLADAYADAAALKRAGHTRDAEMITSLLDRVRRASRTYLLWLNEADARLWSGMSRRWLRTEFEKLEALGFAELREGKPWFRACALPRRADLEELREAGRLAGMEASA